MAREARLMEVSQEHSIQAQTVDELKKKRDGARESLRREREKERYKEEGRGAIKLTPRG